MVARHDYRRVGADREGPDRSDGLAGVVLFERVRQRSPGESNMRTCIRIMKTGADHVELQVDCEAAADLVADEANKQSIKPVIGQRQGLEKTNKHYVVLHGRAADILAFIEKSQKFKVI